MYFNDDDYDERIKYFIYDERRTCSNYGCVVEVILVSSNHICLGIHTQTAHCASWWVVSLLEQFFDLKRFCSVITFLNILPVLKCTTIQSRYCTYVSFANEVRATQHCWGSSLLSPNIVILLCVVNRQNAALLWGYSYSNSHHNPTCSLLSSYSYLGMIIKRTHKMNY